MKYVLLYFILNCIDYFIVEFQLIQSFYCSCPYEGIRVRVSGGGASRAFRRISSKIRSFDDICHRRNHYILEIIKLRFSDVQVENVCNYLSSMYYFCKKKTFVTLFGVFTLKTFGHKFSTAFFVFRQFVFAIFCRLGPFRSNTFIEDTAYIWPSSTVLFYWVDISRSQA